MPTDQVESLTRERRNAHRIIAELPVQNKELGDLIARDKDDSESPLVKVVMTGMAWATYAMALGVMVLLTKAILGR